MPYHNTGSEAIYATADRSKTFKVKPGDDPPAEADVLVVAPGGSVSDDVAALYGLEDALSTEAPTPQTALEREKAGLESAMARRAFEEARVRRATIASLEAEEKALAQRANKAVAKAPADKGR